LHFEYMKFVNIFQFGICNLFGIYFGKFKIQFAQPDNLKPDCFISAAAKPMEESLGLV